MTTERDHGGAGVLVAFALGALAGAVVALLFAPAKGEETREYIGNRAREGREKVKDAASKTRDYLNKQKDNLNSAVDRGREAYHAAREKEQA